MKLKDNKNESFCSRTREAEVLQRHRVSEQETRCVPLHIMFEIRSHISQIRIYNW